MLNKFAANDGVLADVAKDAPPVAGHVIKNHDLGLFQKLHAATITLIPMAGFVLGCILLPFYGMSILTLGMLVVLYFLTMVLGITVGFHRLLTHRSFSAPAWLRAVLTILGCMAAQGPPVYWVSNHRRHHQFSDEPLDPHSPRYNREMALTTFPGFMHSHFGWMFDHDLTNSARYAKDILKDGTVMWVGRYYYAWVIGGLILPSAIAFMLEHTMMAAVMAFLWGGLVRLFLSFHATSSVNSICHLFGNRDHETSDGSRNNMWLAIITGGESWHNNHHAFPYSARFGLKWYQLDLGYLMIAAMEKLALIDNVKRAK